MPKKKASGTDTTAPEFAESAAKLSLILRTCAADMSSYNGFIWPREGRAAAPDWEPSKECGRGLHGFLNGEGDGSLASWADDAVWIAAWVPTEELIELDGKVKFPWADVAVAGTREEAIAFLRANGCTGAIVGATITGGDGATITGGVGATITGGVGATITGGDGATITGGDGATITGGDGATITGGDGATITGGYGATITGGDRATITGGDRATITGGDGATITGGDRATITGGDGATIVIRYWNGQRYKTAVFDVGEAGVKPNTPYRVNDKGELQEVQDQKVGA